MGLATLQQLNIDGSLPVSDAFNATNANGIIRYITAADAKSLPAMNRLQGDIANRTLIIAAAINQVIQLLNAQPFLISFDNTHYVLDDGAHPFVAPVAGIDPTASNHLSTRNYVDLSIANLTTIFDGLAAQLSTLQIALPLYTFSPFTSYSWSAGAKTIVTLTLDNAVVNPANIIGMMLIEQLNIGTLLAPVYVYRQLMHGTLGGSNGTGAPGSPAGDGFHVDDFWLSSLTTVTVLIPNLSSYATGYASYGLQAPVARSLRAVVWESQSGTPTATVAPSDYLYLLQYLDGAAAIGSFAGWKPARNQQIFGIQLAAQVAPVGADLWVELADVNGNSLGAQYRAVLPAGSKFAETIFANPYPLARASIMRLRVTQIGSSTAGSDISATLIYLPS
jgi:hypothetical protein